MLQDYYPFGMQMPNRAYSSPDYRYGFNGMEKDDEIKGSGTSIDFGARMYDSRLGKFISLDPLSKKAPSESNYIFAGNNPIFLIDIAGEYKYPANKAQEYKNRYPMITLYLEKYIKQDIEKSTDLQNSIIKNSENTDVNSEYLLNTVADWDNKDSPEIIFDKDLYGNAYTVDSKGFSINADYAAHIEAILADPETSFEDKQAAITRFYMTLVDETTITLHKKTLKNDRAGVDYPDGRDPGDKVVDEMYLDIEIEITDGTFTIKDPADNDLGRGNLDGTKNVVKRKIENGQSDRIPTVPQQ